MTRKRIVFLTLYDPTCMGVRLLSSIARSKGVESFIVIYKRDSHRIPVFYGGKSTSGYTYYHGGVLRRSVLSAIRPTSKEESLLISKIQELRPDLLCLSTRSFALNLCKRLIPKIRRAIPGVPVIAGGWGPTFEDHEFLEFSDYVAFGEGERTISDLVDCLKDGRGFSGVNNLSFKGRDGEVVRNPVNPPVTIEEMGSLPFPDIDLGAQFFINQNRVQQGEEFFNNKVYDCSIGRGCPLSCSYCMSGRYQAMYRSHGYHCPKVRFRTVDTVINELLVAKENGAVAIRFIDEVFPFDKRWLEQFMDAYSEKIQLPFFGYLRLEFHKESMIRRLVDTGLRMSTVGVQSGSDRLLREVLRRRLSSETTLRFAELLSELDVKFIYHFLTDNPFESEEDLIQTFELCCRLPFAKTNVFRVAVFSGSVLERMIDEKDPTPLRGHLFDWYSILYCMATEGPRFRRLSMFMFRHRVLKRFPYLIQVLFLPYVVREAYDYLRNSRKYKGYIPSVVPQARESGKQMV